MGLLDGIDEVFDGSRGPRRRLVLIVDSAHEDRLADLYERVGFIPIGAPTCHGVTSRIPYQRFKRIVISHEMKDALWTGTEIIKKVIIPFHRERSGVAGREDWFKPTKFIVYAKSKKTGDRMRDLLVGAGLTAKHIPYKELVRRLEKG